MGRKRGGLFDFNRDGKESIREMYVAYQMYQKWLKRKEAKEIWRGSLLRKTGKSKARSGLERALT